MHKLKTFVKTRWSFFVGWIFVWIIPLVLLSENVATIKEVSVGIKITWIGCLALIVLALAFRKFVHGQILRLKHGVLRAILKSLHKIITCGLLAFILAYLDKFAGILFKWWTLCCVSIFVGLCFYFYDELRAEKFEKAKRKEEILSVLNEQKEKNNG